MKKISSDYEEKICRLVANHKDNLDSILRKAKELIRDCEGVDPKFLLSKEDELEALVDFLQQEATSVIEIIREGKRLPLALCSTSIPKPGTTMELVARKKDTVADSGGSEISPIVTKHKKSRAIQQSSENDCVVALGCPQS